MNPIVRTAGPPDFDAVLGTLREAADWLRQRGIPLWREDELLDAAVAPDLEAGLYVVAQVDGRTAGTMRFQLSDPEVWPDVPEGESTFVHRLAVRRAFAGTGVSTALLEWAAARTRALGRPYLRLDCEQRPKLRTFYEAHGFEHHSDFQHAQYFVARYQRRVDGR